MNTNTNTNTESKNWYQWKKINPGFWAFMRFLAEFKRGDIVPRWFTEYGDYEVEDEGGWWFTIKLVLLLITSAFVALFIAVWFALHYCWGWIMFGSVGGAIGLFVLIPMGWRAIFRGVDKAQAVKEKVTKLEKAISAQVQDQDGRDMSGSSGSSGVVH